MHPRWTMKQNRSSFRAFTMLSDIFIALMLTVFLFWFDSTGYGSITEAKLPVFRAICGGYVILSIILIPSCLVTGIAKTADLKQCIKESTWTQRMVLLFMLLTVLASLLSPYRRETWQGVSRYEGTVTICIYCLCFVFLSSFGRVRKWMAYLLGASLSVFSVICIIQLYGGNPLGLFPEGLNYFGAGVDYTGAYLGTIGNTDLVAAFLCIAITILWVAVVRMKGKLRTVLIIPIALSLFVLAKMSVMAGILGVFGGAVLSLPVVLPISDKAKKVIAIVIALTIIICIAFLFIVDIDIGMLHEAHELLRGRIDETFGSGRIYIWKSVLERIPDNLLFGTGPDTMNYAGIEAFSRYDEIKNVEIVAEIDTAHNEYLNVLYHQGIFALLAYLAALVFAAKVWICRGGKKTESAAIGAAVLSYCIQAFFGISMFLTAPFFWISLGLLDNSCRE